MEKQIFGATDIEVARIGQGTWNLEKSSLKQVKEAVHHGIDLGMTHIDTAEMYGNGAVERVLGQVLRGIREKVFLVSKVLPKNATYEGTIVNRASEEWEQIIWTLTYFIGTKSTLSKEHFRLSKNFSPTEKSNHLV